MEFSRKGRRVSTYGCSRASTDPGGCPRHTDMAEAVPGGPKGFWATVQSSGIAVITCKRTGWKVFPKCATSKRVRKDRWVTTPQGRAGCRYTERTSRTRWDAVGL